MGIVRDSIRSLVTGGAGFIGSHLVDRLLEEGHEVILLDNFSTGMSKNLGKIHGHPRLKIYCLDVADHKAIRPHFSGVDWVFHLAALADIVPSIERPLDYYHSNVDGTVAVAEASREARVKLLIYAASSSCYGIPDVFPTPESAEIRPQYPYALTKYLGEQIVLHWGKVYRMPCISLRFFNVYGPRARTTGSYGAVFGVFLAQKLAGKPFTIVGDGAQSRDFTYVTDAVEAFLLAARSGMQGEIFNVGSGNTYRVNYLVDLLGGGKVIHIPRRPREPDCTFADISKISRALGWRPRVSFEEGVRKMLENINDWRGAPVWDERSIEEATRSWFANLGSKHDRPAAP